MCLLRTYKWICKQTTQFLLKSMAAYYVIAHNDLLLQLKMDHKSWTKTQASQNVHVQVITTI